MSTSTSLLQDVLRPQAFGADGIHAKLAAASLNEASSPTRQAATLDDSDDELVGVMSIPGSPSRSAAPSRQPSRPSSPTRMGASKRKVPGPLIIGIGKSKERSSDPLRAFPTEIAQRIFAQLSIRDLARCARVCRKWQRSQTLNYVWFLHVRSDSFEPESLPPGKWTRRESKQNWRLTYMQNAYLRDKEEADRTYTPPARYSRPTTPFNTTLAFANIMSATEGPISSRVSNGGSGYVTPKEAREEQWRLEAEEQGRLTKNEMRDLYKELGGRKARTKAKFGGATRDKGGWSAGGDLDDY